MKRSIRIAAMAAALSLAALGAQAESLIFSLGFAGPLTANAHNGKIRYVDVHIGSNEDNDNPEAWVIIASLRVLNGNQEVCSTGIEKIMEVRPAVRPLRFQVFSPPLLGNSKTDLRNRVKYKLAATLEVREPGTSRLVYKTQNVMEYDWNAGGVPSCRPE